MKRYKPMAAFLLTLLMLATTLGVTALAAGSDRTVSLNQTFSDSLNTMGEKDKFSFSLSQPGSLQVTGTFPVEGNFNVRLYRVLSTGGAGNVQSKIFNYSGSTASGTFSGSSDKVRLPAGSYYVEVYRPSGWRYSDKTYSLKLVYQKESASQYEMEYNDTAQTSSVVTPGSKIIGNLSSSSDVDYYKMTLPEPGVVQPKLTFDYMGDYTVIFYGVNRTDSLYTIASGSFSYSGSTGSGTVSQAMDRLRLPADDYYIKVQKRSGGTYTNSDYTLSLPYTAEPASSYEKEWNEDAQASQLIDTNQTITGNLNTRSDVDFYKVVLPQKATVQPKIEMAASSAYAVNLYQINSKGQLMTVTSTGWVNTIGATRYGDQVTLPAGEYYLKVTRRNNGTYSNADYKITLLSSYTTGNYPSDWAEGEVSDAIDEGLVPDDMQGQYKDHITRGEFCTLAVTLVTTHTGKVISQVLSDKGLSIDPTMFRDTQDYNVLAAAALGIVNGYTDGTFRPSATITRAEAAAMLQRTSYALGVRTPNGSSVSFVDSSSIGSWAKSSVQFISAMVDKETNTRVMGGIGGGKFGPNEPYTKEQSYLTMVRLLHAMDR